MNLAKLNITGDCHADRATLEKFSRDKSSYRILPVLVVEPRNEQDVVQTLEFARNEGLGIVSRSGGSGLSGAAVGPGIVLNFKKHLNRVISVGEETVVQPGAVLDHFLRQMAEHNLMLPSVPVEQRPVRPGRKCRHPLHRPADRQVRDAGCVRHLAALCHGRGRSGRHGPIPARSSGRRSAAHPGNVHGRHG